MWARRGLAAAGTAIVVLLALWATAGPHLDYAQPPEPTAPTATLPTDDVDAAEPLPDAEAQAKKGVPAPGWLVAIGTVLLALLFVAIVYVFARFELSRRRRVAERRREGALSTVAGETLRFDLGPDIIDAADDVRAALMVGEPRNAIVACWLALEATAETGGYPRRPAETSAEFTERVIGLHLVDETAITTLANLYREARFSVHELSEPHREAAIGALDRLVADLSARQPSETPS